MSDSDIMTEMLILSERLSNSKNDLALARSDPSENLKLFKVTVWMLTDNDRLRGPIGRKQTQLWQMAKNVKGIETFILDVDGPSAERAVLSNVNRANIHPDKMVDTEEIVGPFSAGQVLFTNDFGEK